MSSASVDASHVLDPESQAVIDSDIRAGYKIEITFGTHRSTIKDYWALVSLWESGKFFHGGGDSNMYFCLDNRKINPNSAYRLLIALLDGKEKRDDYGCGYPIPGSAMGGGIALCPTCQRPVNTDYIVGQFPFYGSTQDLARLVARYFRVLKDNADIYCKYSKLDIRYMEMERKKGADVARRLRGMFIYPLNRIIRDVISGASLESRLAAFFNA